MKHENSSLKTAAVKLKHEPNTNTYFIVKSYKSPGVI